MEQQLSRVAHTSRSLRCVRLTNLSPSAFSSAQQGGGPAKGFTPCLSGSRP